jgi:hypothetical protein
VVTKTVQRLPDAAHIASIEDVFQFDATARRIAKELLTNPF